MITPSHDLDPISTAVTIPRMVAQLEIACFTVHSSITAQCAGADRIELCTNRDLGGIAPDSEKLRAVKLSVQIPVFVMIRPRGGDFLYSDDEFDLMKAQIRILGNAGADGFVFGILTGDNKVDVLRNKELVDLANGKPCTFHRAFDAIADYDEGLEDVCKCLFKNILTAGCMDGEGAAVGTSGIERLVDRAKRRINIMPGGGVRSGNLEILKKTGAGWFHSSGIVSKDDDADADYEEIQLLKSMMQDTI
jgi:copper homeostasis protein